MQRIVIKWLGAYINLLAHIAPGFAGKFGFRMFGRPVRWKIKPQEKKFLDTTEPFSFQHTNIRIQGYRWGTGPKRVLLLHGWQSHSGRWNELVQALSKPEYTIYALDAPGHGRSSGSFFSAPLNGEVIRHFGMIAGPFHSVVGHSLGAFSALYVLSEFKDFGTGRMVAMTTPGEVKNFVNHFKKRLNLSEKSLTCIRDYFKEEVGRSYDDFSVSRFADNLNLQGLIIHDRSDKFAPLTYAERLHKKWIDSQLMVTEGLGHHLIDPIVIKAIVDFICNDKTNYGNTKKDGKTYNITNESDESYKYS